MTLEPVAQLEDGASHQRMAERQLAARQDGHAFADRGWLQGTPNHLLAEVEQVS